jgi:pyruvate formate lyase activating enzyme
MEFKGLLPLSLIEYPGKVVAVVHTGGCNFRCPWCYNRDLVLKPASLPSISEQDVLNFLSLRKKWLDGLAITGGEPTIHAELPKFIKKVKKLGFSVALETNGSNPEMLGYLIKHKLVDYVALDIKAPLTWARYRAATGVKNEEIFEKILKSLDILKRGKIDYELRTTFVPKLLNSVDIVTIAKQIKNAKKYVLQQFVPRTTIRKKYEALRPRPHEELEKLKKRVKRYVKFCEIRA